MKKSLAAIIATGLISLVSPVLQISQVNAQTEIATETSDTLRYHFRATARIPIINMVSLLTGEIKYYKNNNKISGEIIPTGGIAKFFDKDIAHRIYSTTFYPDSIVYIQKEDSLESEKTIRKTLSRNSPYFDALTSASILLDYIEKDSLDYHPLVKYGTITLFVDNKIISAKLSSIEEEKIKYNGKKVIAKKISIENCPDDRTFFDLIIYNRKPIEIYCRIKRGLGINLSAKLTEDLAEDSSEER